jgi:hypothetical protein
LPMSMTASVILTNLPKDASAALKEVEEMDERKGTFTSCVGFSISSPCLGRLTGQLLCTRSSE